MAILGPNASGKSTLLQLIAGAIAPLSGRVELDGFETSRLDARTRAQRIAMVQQESPLVFPMRAGDYVLQGRHPHGRSLWFESEEDFAIATNALAQVGAEHLRDRWMHEISGGEKQRVVLARALAQQPWCCCWTSLRCTWTSARKWNCWRGCAVWRRKIATP